MEGSQQNQISQGSPVPGRPDVREAIAQEIQELTKRRESLYWLVGILPPAGEPVPESVEDIIWLVLQVVRSQTAYGQGARSFRGP